MISVIFPSHKICFFHQCNHRWLDSRLCQLVEKAGSEKTDRAVGEHVTGLVTDGVGFRLTECAGRDSNPGQRLGRPLYYHYTTGAYYRRKEDYL